LANRLTVDGRPIDYQQSGDGPPILFVPGSFSTPAAWTGIQKLLPPRYRFVATSLCGYGGTAETRSLDDNDIAHLVKVVTTAAREVGEPVHLVGHSLGGTAALATALAGEIDVLSITTYEANPVALIREGGHTEMYEATWQMSRAFEAAHSAGEPDAAGRIIDFWGGAGSFAGMPEPVQDFCRATTFANVLDWRTVFTFNANSDDYASLSKPALLIRGSRAVPEMVRITDGLAASIPNARAEIIDGANHFLIATHIEQCAALLTAFLAELGGTKR
jgi:pimeloyl-ACP methyl ester carboxylesterase